MPVLLANADPGFPFVDCVHRQAGDLFPAPPAVKSLVVDFAGSDGTPTKAGPERADASLVEREVWGFWPPVRAGNAVLIRDDLLDFAAQAARAADHASWALLLVDPATVVRLAGGADAAGTGPLTHDILAAIRAEKAGVAMGRTTRQSTDTTQNLYLRRILVVASDLGENTQAVSAAFALVRDDLVDNVIFLAAREPRHAERHAVTFAGLRLVETLASARNVETWFQGSVGPKQKAVAVMRLTIDRSLLATPTSGHRRLTIVQTMIEELLKIEHDGRREAAVRQSADEIAKVRATIVEEGRPAPTGWVEEAFGSNGALAGHAIRKPGGPEAIVGHAEARLAAIRNSARRVVDESALAEAARTGSGRTGARAEQDAFLDPMAPRRQRGVEAKADRDIDARIQALQSGLFRDADQGLRDLDVKQREVGEDIARLAGDQRGDRRIVHDGASGETAGAAFDFIPPDAGIAALAEPIVLELGGDRQGRAVALPVAAELAAFAHATRVAGESESGLLRWLPTLAVLAATVLALVLPLHKVGLLTWRNLSDAASWRSPAFATFLGALAVTLPVAIVAAFRSAMAAHVRAVSRMEAAHDALVESIRTLFEAVRRYRANHLTAGRHALLRRRVRALADDLGKLERVKEIQAEILRWPTVPIPGDDPVSVVRAKLDAELASVPRERWVSRLLRAEAPPAPIGTARYNLDGSTPLEIRSATFLDRFGDDGVIALQRLTEPVPAPRREAEGAHP